MRALKVIGYPSGAAIVASLGVLLVGGCIFGFQFAEWAEWEGRIVGVVGTIAGVAGAAFGLSMALSAGRRAVK